MRSSPPPAARTPCTKFFQNQLSIFLFFALNSIIGSRYLYAGAQRPARKGSLRVCRQIKLEICGASYVIATTDTEEYILSLAEKLDADMNQMMTNNPSASIATAAVITALGYLDELKKSTSGADNMRAQIKDYLEDAAKAKLSAEEARREVERLRREIGYLKENH